MTILNLFFVKYFLQFERFLFPRWILILWWHGTPYYSNNPPFVINLCIVRSVPATSGASGQGRGTAKSCSFDFRVAERTLPLSQKFRFPPHLARPRTRTTNSLTREALPADVAKGAPGVIGDVPLVRLRHLQSVDPPSIPRG